MRIHPHIMKYVKTGIAFTYSDAEVDEANRQMNEAFERGDFDFRPPPAYYNPFAGPVVNAYKCTLCDHRENRPV